MTTASPTDPGTTLRIPLVQVDAFADRLFEGNPAAVMPLEDWLPDAVLQQLAAENNLSETAFLVDRLPEGVEAAADPGRPTAHLRWFTPTVEVDLCGHATLAAASYLLGDVHPGASGVRLWSRSGWLGVDRAGEDAFTLDFPTQAPVPVTAPPGLDEALGVPVLETLQGRGEDLVCVVADAAAVGAVRPDLAALASLPARGVVVTASGEGTAYDFVSRFFAPQSGIGEDPVTGSAHSQIATLWATRLGRDELVARQLSARGGTVRCRVAGERTFLTGTCRRYLEGVVTLP